MAKRDPRMIPLGYGKFVRADRVYALVPLEGPERQDGRRTYVHVDGLTEPVVASRSERAILADVEPALGEAAGLPRRLDVGQDRALRAGRHDRLGEPVDVHVGAMPVAALRALDRHERVDAVGTNELPVPERDHAGVALCHRVL